MKSFYSLLICVGLLVVAQASASKESDLDELSSFTNKIMIIDPQNPFTSEDLLKMEERIDAFKKKYGGSLKLDPKSRKVINRAVSARNFYLVKSALDNCLKEGQQGQGKIATMIASGADEEVRMMTCVDHKQPQDLLRMFSKEAEANEKRIADRHLQDLLYEKSIKYQALNYAILNWSYLHIEIKPEDIAKELCGAAGQAKSKCSSIVEDSLRPLHANGKYTFEQYDLQQRAQEINKRGEELNSLLSKYESNLPNATAIYDDYRNKAGQALAQLPGVAALSASYEGIRQFGGLYSPQKSKGLGAHYHGTNLNADKLESIVRDTLQKMREQTHKLNAEEKQSFDDDQLAEMFKTSPFALGKVLLKNPQYVGRVCELLGGNNKSIEQAKKVVAKEESVASADTGNLSFVLGEKGDVKVSGESQVKDLQQWVSKLNEYANRFEGDKAGPLHELIGGLYSRASTGGLNSKDAEAKLFSLQNVLYDLDKEGLTSLLQEAALKNKETQAKLTDFVFDFAGISKEKPEIYKEVLKKLSEIRDKYKAASSEKDKTAVVSEIQRMINKAVAKASQGCGAQGKTE